MNLLIECRLRIAAIEGYPVEALVYVIVRRSVA
jgi:hypothetical protein